MRQNWGELLRASLLLPLPRSVPGGRQRKGAACIARGMASPRMERENKVDC